MIFNSIIVFNFKASLGKLKMARKHVSAALTAVTGRERKPILLS